MKKKFSTKWKGSKQPRKQRNYLANAPLHLKKKMMAANLSKELRKQHGTRSLTLRKGDIVKIMRGKFKGKRGKVNRIRLKVQKIEVENIQIKKMDGSKVSVPLKASNVQIVELNLGDRKRGKNLKKTGKHDSGNTETEKKDKQSEETGGKKNVS